MMKTLFLPLLLLFPLLTYALPDTFEGEIFFTKEKDGKKEEALRLFVKDNKVVMNVKDPKSDVSREGARVIIDMQTGQYTTLMDKDGQKTAMQFSMDVFKGMIEEVQDDLYKDDKLEVKVTDETREIDGYECTKVTVKSKNEYQEAWITKEPDFKFSDIFPVIKQTRHWQRFSDNYDGFIMQLSSRESGEKQATYMADITEKELDAAMFEIPEDYNIVNMDKMMEQFKNANPQVYEKMMKELQH